MRKIKQGLKIKYFDLDCEIGEPYIRELDGREFWVVHALITDFTVCLSPETIRKYLPAISN